MASINQKEVANISWELGHLWEVRFVDMSYGDPKYDVKTPPRPFNLWIPVVSNTENLATIVSKDFTFGSGTQAIPEGTQYQDVQLTYIDDVDRTFTRWLQAWMNYQILNGGEFVSPLADCVKVLAMRKVNNSKKDIKSISFGNVSDNGKEKWYIVYPDGSLDSSGSSDSDSPQYTIRMVIVGHI